MLVYPQPPYSVLNSSLIRSDIIPQLVVGLFETSQSITGISYSLKGVFLGS
jgi:hypothetical protein